MVLSCLRVIGGHYIRVTKALVINKPITIFYTKYGKS